MQGKARQKATDRQVETGRWHREFLHLAVLIIFMALCGLFLCAAAEGEDTYISLPFKVENRLKAKEAKKFDARHAALIYDAVSRQVAQELSPHSPRDLRPDMVLILDASAECDSYMYEKGQGTITLRAWNPKNFADGVAVATMRQALSDEELATAINRGLRTANMRRFAVVNAKELSKE